MSSSASVGLTIEGVDQITAGGLLPPDTHGAVGLEHYVQVVNSHIDIYEKCGSNTQVKSLPLSAFFGYFEQILFDPRIIYDPTWNRWVVIAEAFPESETIQRQFIGVSTGSDPTGSFYIYSVDVNYAGIDFFWDYPQLGMDQNSIILTANIFPEFTASMFAVAKSRLYNGLSFSVPVFTGLMPTLAPPIVLDQNDKTFLIAAPYNSAALKLYTLENSSSPTGIKLSEPADCMFRFTTFRPPPFNRTPPRRSIR